MPQLNPCCAHVWGAQAAEELAWLLLLPAPLLSADEDDALAASDVAVEAEEDSIPCELEDPVMDDELPASDEDGWELDTSAKEDEGAADEGATIDEDAAADDALVPMEDAGDEDDRSADEEPAASPLELDSPLLEELLVQAASTRSREGMRRERLFIGPPCGTARAVSRLAGRHPASRRRSLRRHERSGAAPGVRLHALPARTWATIALACPCPKPCSALSQFTISMCFWPFFWATRPSQWLMGFPYFFSMNGK
jgi:hypothetical protein